MAEPFLGEVRLMSFFYAPKGWALCNGQLLSINQNQALFSLLGTAYGGDGRVSFALPDLRGRVPMHVGGGHTLGERGGELTHTLSLAELPTHTHGFEVTNADATSNDPQNALLAAHSGGYAAPGSPPVALNVRSVENYGGSQPHTNLQPYLTLAFCIALQGIFPEMNLP